MLAGCSPSREKRRKALFRKDPALCFKGFSGEFLAEEEETKCRD